MGDDDEEKRRRTTKRRVGERDGWIDRIFQSRRKPVHRRQLPRRPSPFPPFIPFRLPHVLRPPSPLLPPQLYLNSSACSSLGREPNENAWSEYRTRGFCAAASAVPGDVAVACQACQRIYPGGCDSRAHRTTLQYTTPPRPELSLCRESRDGILSPGLS